MKGSGSNDASNFKFKNSFVGYSKLEANGLTVITKAKLIYGFGQFVFLPAVNRHGHFGR
jgi:hypothetical protein